MPKRRFISDIQILDINNNYFRYQKRIYFGYKNCYFGYRIRNSYFWYL